MNHKPITQSLRKFLKLLSEKPTYCAIGYDYQVLAQKLPRNFMYCVSALSLDVDVVSEIGSHHTLADGYLELLEYAKISFSDLKDNTY